MRTAVAIGGVVALGLAPAFVGASSAGTDPGQPAVCVFGREPGGTVRLFAGSRLEDLGHPRGLAVASGVAAVADRTGVQVFVRGADGSVWTRRQEDGWSEWTSLGGKILDTPAAAVAPGGNEIHLLALGTDGAIWTRTGRGAAFTAWESLGGSLESGPAVCADVDSIRVFARGTDRAIWTRQRTTEGWSEWTSLGGKLVSAPAAATTGEGTVVVAAQGTDGAAWVQEHGMLGWGGWKTLDGALLSGPALAAGADGSMILVVRGTDDTVWARRLRGGSVAAWEAIDARTTDTPAVLLR